MLRLPACVVDLDGLVVERDGVRTTLTPQEGELLAFLGRANGPVSREDLLKSVWGYAPGIRTRAVDATVSRLRMKIERDPAHPEALLTVRGRGYRLEGLSAPAPVPPVTGLLGRESELVAIRTALDSAGLVQLVGPGGAGKTTLAREILASRGGAFVDLQSARSLADVWGALGREMGHGGGQTGRAEQERILAALSHAPRLLVLDNLEQLPDGLVDLVERLATTGSPLLLTTRTVLDAARAQVAVGSLPLHLARQLLAAAARRRQPAWPGATDRDLDALAEAADGLPLHLELVGAHLALLPPRDLLARLKGLLDHGDGRTGRHRSRASVVAWSWSMLSPADQRRLAWWATVRGPLDPATAEAIVPDGDDGLAIETLARLHQFALLDTTGGHPRLWATVRAFAARELDRSGERASAETAHARWFVARVPPDLVRSNAGPEWDAHVQVWGPDLTAVAQRFVDKAPDWAVTAIVGLLIPRNEGIGKVLELLELLGRAVPSTSVRVRLRARLAQLDEARRTGVDAGALIEECLAAVEEVDDPGLRLAVTQHHAEHLRRMGDLEPALAWYRQARAQAHGRVLPRWVAQIDHGEAAALRRLGRLDEARELFHRSLAAGGAGADPRLAALCLQALASIARASARPDEAIELGARAVASARVAGDQDALGGALTNHANALTSAGRHEEAAAINREAIAVLERAGIRTTLSFALGNLGSVLDRLGQRVEAELLIRRALAQAEAANVPYAAAYWASRLADLAHRDGRLDEALEGYEAARVRLERAGADVHRVQALAAVAAAEIGRVDRARALLEDAAALAERSPLDRHLLTVCRAAVARWTGAAAPDGLAEALKACEADPELLVVAEIHARST